MLFTGVRFFGAGILTLLLNRSVTGNSVKFSKKLIKPTITQALLQTVGQYLFLHMGMTIVSGASGALISSSSAFFTVIVAATLGFEKLTGRKISGVALGLAGILILNTDSNLQLTFRWNGELLILLSTICNVFASLNIKRLSSDHDPITLTGYQFIFGGAMLAIVGELGGGRLTWPGVGASLLYVYLMLVASVAYSLWNWLIKQNDISSVVVFHSLTPVFGALFSWLILNENIWRWQLVFALTLIVIGINVLNRNKVPRFPFQVA